MLHAPTVKVRGKHGKTWKNGKTYLGSPSFISFRYLFWILLDWQDRGQVQNALISGFAQGTSTTDPTVTTV